MVGGRAEGGVTARHGIRKPRCDESNGVGREVAGERQKLFCEDSGFQLLDPRGLFVELHLDDLVETTIDGGKTFVHLFTEADDLIAPYCGPPI